MTDTNYLQAIPLTIYDTSGLAAGFASMNGTGTEEPVKLLKMYNASSVGVTISLDGVTNHDFIPAGGTFILDLETNADAFEGGHGHWNVRKFQIFYGKGSAGTGNLYIIGYY